MSARRGTTPSGTKRRPVPKAPSTEALTSDLWYTLAYLRPRERAELERGRESVWRTALEAAGIERRRAVREVAFLFQRARSAEAAGRTPTILEQAGALSRRLGLPKPLPGDEIGQALDRNLLHRTVHVAPGARQALRSLARAGVELGLVSNVLFETPEGTRTLLDRLDLRTPFRSVFLSPEHPFAKPDSRPFRFALRELGAAPRASSHIGDLLWDVLGARRAGMRAILYTGLHRFERPRPRLRLARGAAPPQRVRSWDRVPRLLHG